MVIFFNKETGEITSTIDNLDNFTGPSEVSYLCIEGYDKDVIKNGRVDVGEKNLILGTRKVRPSKVFVNTGDDLILKEHKSINGSKRPMPAQIQKNFQAINDILLKMEQSNQAFEARIAKLEGVTP